MDWLLHFEHPWDVSTEKARHIQTRLAEEVREEALPEPPKTVAGLDVSIRGERAQAAVAVLDADSLEVIDSATHQDETPFPYVPGLLSFREVPVLLPALRKLTIRPDVLMCDSQGLAHPRRFGLACHLGVLFNWPAFGVAKSRLTGSAASTLPPEKGSHVPLQEDGTTLGAVLRTRTNVNPVYVSIGHRITLPDAIEVTLSASPKYKIPEPTRAAHRLSRG